MRTKVDWSMIFIGLVWIPLAMAFLAGYHQGIKSVHCEAKAYVDTLRCKAYVLHITATTEATVEVECVQP